MTLEVQEASAAQAYAVFLRIPEFNADLTPQTDFAARLESATPHIAICLLDGEPVGFKAGYDRYRDGSFYSWLGGVVPVARKSGAATALLLEQEAWAIAAGFDAIYVRTRNRFKGMRALLARNGYDIVSYAQGLDVPPAEGRITLVKHLT